MCPSSGRLDTSSLLPQRSLCALYMIRPPKVKCMHNNRHASCICNRLHTAQFILPTFDYTPCDPLVCLGSLPRSPNSHTIFPPKSSKYRAKRLITFKCRNVEFLAAYVFCTVHTVRMSKMLDRLERFPLQDWRQVWSSIRYEGTRKQLFRRPRHTFIAGSQRICDCVQSHHPQRHDTTWHVSFTMCKSIGFLYR
jgi:hypothetical protein